VGSAFKLFVLAELARQGRKLDEVTQLRDEHKSLPSGFLQTWPAGAPLTLHTLATLMISVSDNTAADHLIHLLGREALEKNLAASGHHHPEGMRPFLTTVEMFRLKMFAGESVRAAYAKANEAERRKILTTLKQPLGDAGAVLFTRPTYIDSIEWFASVGDLCRVMDVLRKAKPVREALAVNVPATVDKGWTFSGYKGGSEPGVINMSFVLEGKRGSYCVAATWNDPVKPVEEVQFAGYVQAMIRQLEK
jgi:beta-lactamase class A